MSKIIFWVELKKKEKSCPRTENARRPICIGLLANIMIPPGENKYVGGSKTHGSCRKAKD